MFLRVSTAKTEQTDGDDAMSAKSRSVLLLVLRDGR